MKIFDLTGKTALIIGAGVLGSAIARGFGQAGANIALGYRNTPVDDLKNELETLGVKNEDYQVDSANLESVASCRDEILQDFGAIDILVITAGGNVKEAMTTKDHSFFTLPLSALKEVVWQNLFAGAVIPAQVFGETMQHNRQGASIITISSMNAFRPLEGRPGYAAAKAALTNFTQWLAVYMAKECNSSVRVNAIAPGFFLNPRLRTELLDNEGNYRPRGQAIISHTPMGRLGEAEDLAGTAIWLASDASKFVTGVVIPVDGGFNAYAGL